MSADRRAPAPVYALRWLTALAVVLAAGIALLEYELSFEVLSELATRADIPAGIA